jgi:colanic acid biosynthesis glycosyl transferase WcaI
MGVKQGLDVILDAAGGRRAQSDLLYVLVGDGARRAALEARVRAERLSNVRIIPLLERDKFHRLLALADLCLVTQQQSVSDIVFPSKVVTLLAVGKPVIASVAGHSDVARVLVAAQAGEVVGAESPEELADAVARWIADPGRRRRASRSGRAFARQHWDQTSALEHLDKRLASLVSGHVARTPVSSASVAQGSLREP